MTVHENMVRKVKVLFLDRDGTINRDIGTYVTSKEQFQLIDGAGEAIALAKQAGFEIVIITNQAGIAKGIVTSEQVEDMHLYLNELLADSDTSYDRIYYCPTHPDYPHPEYDSFAWCRKPETGMVDRAVADYLSSGVEVATSQSFFIGDKTVDIECGLRAGLRTVLVRTGHGEEELCRKRGIKPEFVADNLHQAITEYVLSSDE